MEDEWVVAKNFTYDSHQQKLIDCYEPGYLSEDMSAPTSPTSVTDSIPSSTGGYTGNGTTTMTSTSSAQRTSVIKQNSQFFEKFEEMDIKAEIKTEYTETQSIGETASTSSPRPSVIPDIKSEPVYGQESFVSRQSQCESSTSRTNSGSSGDHELETSIKGKSTKTEYY